MNEPKFGRIDHIAIAVNDLDRALTFYQEILGMPVVEQRVTQGNHSGMVSAVVDGGTFTIVLVQGTSEDSQVSRYIKEFGCGVQHVAFQVDDIETSKAVLEERGLAFATTILNGPGLRQAFSKRDRYSGMMYELIERTGEGGFVDDNVNELFRQLEDSDAY